MNALRMLACAFVSILSAAAVPIFIAVAPTGSATSRPAVKPRAVVVFSHPLPKLDGAQLTTTVLEVNYGPGESSIPHSHPCAVIGYVTHGSIRTQVKGQIETILKTGETFYEAPNAVHLVSADASRTKPASFLAIFICDHDAPLSSDVPSGPGSGENQ
jgi:quercetin dioxygenase-like cupin family protein